jgi:hypothetical protein
LYEIYTKHAKDTLHATMKNVNNMCMWMSLTIPGVFVVMVNTIMMTMTLQKLSQNTSWTSTCGGTFQNLAEDSSPDSTVEAMSRHVQMAPLIMASSAKTEPVSDEEAAGAGVADVKLQATPKMLTTVPRIIPKCDLPTKPRSNGLFPTQPPYPPPPAKARPPSSSSSSAGPSAQKSAVVTRRGSVGKAQMAFNTPQATAKKSEPLNPPLRKVQLQKDQTLEKALQEAVKSEPADETEQKQQQTWNKRRRRRSGSTESIRSSVVEDQPSEQVKEEKEEDPVEQDFRRRWESEEQKAGNGQDDSSSQEGALFCDGCLQLNERVARLEKELEELKN